MKCPKNARCNNKDKWSVQLDIKKSNGKAIPFHAWTGPGGSRNLRLPHFMTIGTSW